jgi:hypothetical protein
MEDKRIIRNLMKYVHEVRYEATSHCKAFLLVSATILLGCNVAIYWDMISRSLGIAVGMGVAVAAITWLGGFAMGVVRRKGPWQQAFPPYVLLSRALLPSLILGVGVGIVAAAVILLVPLGRAAGAALLGWLLVQLTMHLLFILHTPLTSAAVKSTGDPNIQTVDSYRYTWFFPALGVLAMYVAGSNCLPLDWQALFQVAVTAGIGTSWAMAGFGSGYIP